MLIMLGLLFQFLIISRLYSKSTRKPNEPIRDKKGFNSSSGAHYLKLDDDLDDEDEYNVNEKVLFDLNKENEIYTW